MRLPVVLFLAVSIVSAGCAQPSFEEKLATSKANIESGEGKVYDDALTQALSGASQDIIACYQSNPGKKDVHGFFEFGDKGYTVTLRPQDAFTDCLTKAMEGRDLPPPPRRPYLNYASFVYAPKS
ncbi:hypothetical protein [Arenimonas sp.]|uniref:hypothetical protein n=1 Tax=Arenimonas sp. TaxID=1872635 RepID=UPI0039E24BA9